MALRGLAGMALIPAGLGSYMAYLYRLSGDPLAFATVQRDWSRGFILPAGGTVERAALRARSGPQPDPRHLRARPAARGPDLPLPGGDTRGGARTAPSYTLYGLATLLVLLSSGMGGALVLHSNGRMVMLLFPVFIVLARWGRHRLVHLTILTVSCVLFALCVALFVRWYPVA